MGKLSKKITRYVIDAGAVSEELYAVYQYGFQIGLEMLIYLFVCMSIAIYTCIQSQNSLCLQVFLCF